MSFEQLSALVLSLIQKSNGKLLDSKKNFLEGQPLVRWNKLLEEHIKDPGQV